MDPTWEGYTRARYFGVPFASETVIAETMKQGYYGLLDSDGMLNMKLMLKHDPGLAEFMPKRAA